MEKSIEGEEKNDTKCPVIEVEWYLKKTDLSKDPHFSQWD